MNTVEIIMTNFAKFDRIEAIVTKPEGDFTCDENTNLRRFMWVMTHDSRETFMCKRNGEKQNEEISCNKYDHNIECTLQNVASGNYCYYVIVSNVYCNPVNSKRGLHQKYFNVEEYPLPQIPKILLLYSRDCEQFMEVMITFRELLEEITGCKVFDCFDLSLSEEVGQNKVDWMRSHVSYDDYKIVVVESSLAVIHLHAVLHHTRVSYREPTWLDELFIYGLKELIDDLQRNTYHYVFVRRVDGFTEENAFLKYLTPYKRYILPRHLRMLLDDLSLQGNLRGVPCIDDINNGNLQKFEQDLKILVNYKRLYPGYLDELILRE